MRRRTLKTLMILMLLMGIAFNSFKIKLVFSQNKILNVPTQYATIQGAIDAANPRDIINISKGTYYEHLTISKDGLKLMGESDRETIIDGNQSSTVMTILANNVTITRIAIRGSSIDGNGIYIYRSSNNTIIGNLFYNCSIGLKMLDAQNNKIVGNIITNNSDSGIMLEVKSSNNLVNNNTITNNRYAGIHAFPYADNNTIEGNLIVNNNYAGIHLMGTLALGNKIMKNILIQNERGILIDVYSVRNVISNNVIVKSRHGIEIWNTSLTRDNVIYHNDLIDNTYQLYPEIQKNFSRWNNEANEGNYWSDYEGEDLDNDGVGETSTPHLGVDYYPLANPRNPIPIFQEERIHKVILRSNDVTARFYFNQTSKEIVFRLVGPVGTARYCNITIPKDLLNPVPSQSWIVTLDGASLGITITENATFTSLYFTYTHRARIHDVRITIGRSGIPISYIVGAIALVLGIFMIVILVMRRRRNRRLSLSDIANKTVGIKLISSYSRTFLFFRNLVMTTKTRLITTKSGKI